MQATDPDIKLHCVPISAMCICMHIPSVSLTPLALITYTASEECARLETRLGTTIDVTKYLYTTRKRAMKILCNSYEVLGF